MMNCILHLPANNSEKSAIKLFRLEKLAPYDPLEHQMPARLKMPTYFFFGDRDWMSSEGALNLVKGKKLKADSDLFMVQNAGHNIMYDNPKFLTDKILQLSGAAPQ